MTDTGQRIGTGSHTPAPTARATATASTEPVTGHPPRTRLTLRVGVTGHRPTGLAGIDAPLLDERIGEMLELVSRVARDAHADAGDAYLAQVPCLRIVSAVAEGVDRIVAEAARARGFELQIVLPFGRDDYAQDFATPHSRAQYEALLAAAATVLELDGTRAAADAAYEAVGRMVAAQCDVLLAIWDGEPPRGKGGTAQIVAEAARLEIPVIWIHAKPPHRAGALIADEGGALRDVGVERIVERLMRLLVPPARADGDMHGHRADVRAEYFRERQPRLLLPLGWIWRTFMDVVELHPRRPQVRLPNFERAAAAEWEREWATAPRLPVGVTEAIDRAVRSHYAWADGLAGYYANLYRSAFVVNYLLGVMAVFLALLGLAVGWEAGGGRDRLRILLTIGVIVLILLNTRIGTWRRWHERWIDYRMLAESLRLFRFLAPLGRVPPFSRPPAHSAYGDPTSSWMVWHLRAVVRDVGLRSARFEQAYLEACRVLLHDVLLGEQVRYHRRTAERFERIDRMLRALGVVTFGGVLVVLVAALLGVHNGWLTLSEAVLPALGGALAAIRGQAELERLVKRSAAMSLHLRRFAAELEGLGPEPASGSLARVADAAARVMIAEHLDWRVVFKERPLELPG